MSTPPRVAGALVVLGESNGEAERDPAHVLAPPIYGAGNHEYFNSYPMTTPSNVITKVWGLLGATTGPEVTVTPSTLPRNYINIVCYKTALNHRFPKIAYDRDGVYDEYNSDCIYDTSSPYFGDEGLYQYVYSTALRQDIFASFIDDTTVTNILDDPTLTPANLRTLFPRWTEESEWDMGVQPYEDAIQVSATIGGLYWQTRKAVNLDEAVDFIAPWYVTYDTEAEGLRSKTRIFCDFSFKFSATTYDGANPMLYELVFPYFQRDYNFGLRYQMIPDHCNWQYSAGYPADGYRSIPIEVFPQNDDGQMEPMRWESEATHGLFLDADGSCWNLGTTVEVKVYIWKAPPKRCFMPKNEMTYNLPAAYTNWKVGGFGGGPFTSAQYFVQSQASSWFTGRAFGSSGNRHDIGHPGLEYVETGISSGIAYSIAAPNPMAIMFWGVCFAPDYDSPLCEQYEVKTFTVTLDESNTYTCDGTPRDGVVYTEYGFKLEDIVIPKVEGFITYIQDYEVTEITKAGEV